MHQLPKLTLIVLILLSTIIILQAQDRNCDPIVLTGSELNCMRGERPEDIVAFKYVSGSGWAQIPVQIDERILLDISAPYDPVERTNVPNCLWNSNRPTAWDVLFYADTKTHIGADTNPNFDADDELVLMASDAGDLRIGNSYPTGTRNGSLCELSIREPLSGNAVLGYIYLFVQTGSLDQAAGADYITYNFSYANNYKSSYTECLKDVTGANPENSAIITDNYEIGFSRRWVEDVLKMKMGNDNNDLLDRRQIFINRGRCTNTAATEERFSNSEGAHIAAIDGPIRAIRSIMGTASGPFTQSNILATSCKVEYEFFFRLHPANGFNDVYDLNSYASGKMTYNRSGSSDAVNGNGGNIGGGATDWSYYDGNPGSLIISTDYNFGVPLGAQASISHYYDDRGSSAGHPCTGDGLAYGSSGFTLRTKRCSDRRYANPNNQTDSEECATNSTFFHVFRNYYFQPPGMTNGVANEYDRYAKNPLNVMIMEDPLPVELLGFKAQAQKDQIVLSWSTASETNNSHFEIERSEDAKIFKKIGQVAGNGTTLAQQDYRFLDAGVLADMTYYYRLKQVDTDGTSSYSKVQTARMQASENDISIYPNPVEDLLSLRIYSEEINTSIIVSDLYGKAVLQVERVLSANTWNTIELDVSGLPAGAYFIRTTKGQVKQFVK
ncbi:MAG: T9SS type A sorting domain-containing protein [Bacteroidota bacterium]